MPARWEDSPAEHLLRVNSLRFGRGELQTAVEGPCGVSILWRSALDPGPEGIDLFLGEGLAPQRHSFPHNTGASLDLVDQVAAVRRARVHAEKGRALIAPDVHEVLVCPTRTQVEALLRARSGVASRQGTARAEYVFLDALERRTDAVFSSAHRVGVLARADTQSDHEAYDESEEDGTVGHEARS